MSETWWTPEAVEALRQAMGWDQSLGKTYACKAILAALTPHVERYADKQLDDYDSEMEQVAKGAAHDAENARKAARAARAEAFEACKRIVRAATWLDDVDSGYRSQDDWRDYPGNVLAALDRAAASTAPKEGK